MNKLFKYMKPFSFMLGLAVVLLFAQAMTDLSLPDFMSDIVNVGIQQSGNEDTVAEILTEEDYRDMVFLLGPDRAQSLEAVYGHVAKGTDAYQAYKDIYTGIDTDIYAYDGLGADDTVKKGLLILQMVQVTDPDQAIDFNGISLPAGTDLVDWIASLPEDQQAMALDKIYLGVSSMEASLMDQASIKATGDLYWAMGRDMDAERTGYILKVGFFMLGLTLLGAAASVAVGFIAAKVAAGLGRNLRSRLFEKISKFSNAEFDQFSTASLITRSTNDVMQVQNLMTMMIRMVIYAPILAVGGIYKAVENNPSMTWIIALAVGVILLAIAIVFSIAMPKFKLVQKLVDKVNLVMRENLTGMLVIRAFNSQAFEEGRFDQANQDLTKTNLFVNRVMVFLMPFMNLVMNATMILIVFVGAREISNSNMQVGDMMAFIQYAMQIIMAFLMMSMMFIMIPRASVAAGRIVEVLETPLAINDPHAPKDLDQKGRGQIQFDRVTFKYPGAEEAMLKDISFTAEPGQTTAIIGSTGSGKTTLVNLMPRLYDPTEGHIYLDGMDIKEMTQEDLRSQMGYLPQKASLFSGDVASNLRFSNDQASDDELFQALETAQCQEFVDFNQDGLKKPISQGGANLSGGQKQRLSIARALVKKAKLYIFDDSFSALDFKTDMKLRKALKDQDQDQTLIIVAQRISTIKNAEQIIVLDDGKIVGKGVHADLMKTCKTYQEIAYSQLSKEELS